jgi:hypothetical protein
MRLTIVPGLLTRGERGRRSDLPEQLAGGAVVDLLVDEAAQHAEAACRFEALAGLLAVYATPAR